MNIYVIIFQLFLKLGNFKLLCAHFKLWVYYFKDKATFRDDKVTTIFQEF